MIKEYKAGVSMIILVITIIVMIILASAGIAITSTIVTNSKKTAFAEDLQQIEDAVKEYYVDNDELPIKYVSGNPVQYSKTLVLGRQDEMDVATLTEELTFNSDNSDSNIFYVVDMNKIKVTSSTRGMTTDNDVYLVSKDTHTIYYLDGVVINGEKYYSITDRLIDIEKEIVVATNDDSTTNVSSFGNIVATKSTELPTNELTLTITGTISQGETLKYNVGSQSTSGAVTIASLPITLTFNANTISIMSPYATRNFNYSKKIYIIKEGTTTQTLTIDASNLNVTIMSTPTAVINRSSTDFNFAIIGSAGKTYYEYVTKIDEVGNEVPYYDVPPTITVEYLKSFGKTTTNVGIKLPKNVQSIQAIQINEAGAVSPIGTIDNISID